MPGLVGVVKDEARPFLARFQAARALGKMGRHAAAAQPALATAMKDNNSPTIFRRFCPGHITFVATKYHPILSDSPNDFGGVFKDFV